MSKTTKTEAELAESAVADAEARLDEAKRMLLAATTEAENAAQEAVELQQRASSGDRTVTVEDLVNATPAAQRLTAYVPHYRTAMTAAEQALRQARTDSVVRQVESGEAGLVTIERLMEMERDVANQVADILVAFETKVSAAMDARVSVVEDLNGTTAHGPRYVLPHGQSDSPLQLALGAGDRTLTVNGIDYPDVFPNLATEMVLKEADIEVSRRRDMNR